MNSEKLLIIGCGDLGRRLARELRESSYRITGVRRHPPLNHRDGLEYHPCDVADAAALETVISENYDVIVITMTPAERSDAGYRRAYVDTCRNLLQTLSGQGRTPRLIIFVSSSGVYGQDDGSWVDEASPTRPASFSGQRLLDAEQLVRASGRAHCIVRFSGIYGPGRNRLIEQVREGRATLTDAFTNRIHADDCAAVLAHLIELHRQGQSLAPVYLASDCAPVPMAEVVQWLASQFGGVNVRHCATSAAPPERVNKRCNNQLLLDSGFEFRYPDYRSGYRMLLAQSE